MRRNVSRDPPLDVIFGKVDSWKYFKPQIAKRLIPLVLYSIPMRHIVILTPNPRRPAVLYIRMYRGCTITPLKANKMSRKIISSRLSSAPSSPHLLISSSSHHLITSSPQLLIPFQSPIPAMVHALSHQGHLVKRLRKRYL